MGQKTNPNLLRLGSYESWNTKYIEEKISELPKHNSKYINFKSFSTKLLKTYGLSLNELKVNHSTSNVTIYLTYYLDIKSSLKTNFLKNKRIKFIAVKEKKFKPKKAINYIYYQKIKNFIENKKILNSNLYLKNKKNYEKFYNKKIFRKLNSKNFYNKNFNSFKEKLFTIANLFYKKSIIHINLKQINKRFETISSEKMFKLKKLALSLRKYQKNDFFREGLNLFYNLAKNRTSLPTFTNFIANQLKRFKRHNFFLRFIRDGLKAFLTKSFSKTKNVRIKIKGRLNARPRAKHRIIFVNGNVPVSTLNSKIIYSESIAFTSNGTLGIKAWLN